MLQLLLDLLSKRQLFRALLLSQLLLLHARLRNLSRGSRLSSRLCLGGLRHRRLWLRGLFLGERLLGLLGIEPGGRVVLRRVGGLGWLRRISTLRDQDGQGRDLGWQIAAIS